MNRYIYYVCEDSYCGEHGINACGLVLAGNENIAYDVAIQEGEDLYNSYEGLESDLYQSIIDMGYKEFSDDFDEAYNEAIRASLLITIGRLKPDITMTDVEIEDELCKIGGEEFIDQYCDVL